MRCFLGALAIKFATPLSFANAPPVCSSAARSKKAVVINKNLEHHRSIGIAHLPIVTIVVTDEREHLGKAERPPNHAGKTLQVVLV